MMPALFPTKRLSRTRLRSASSIEIPGPESEIRFPSIKLSLEPNATCIPGWALCLNELSTTRMSCEAKMPRPSPSGAGLRLPELSRIRLRDDSLTTKPKNLFPFEETSITRLSRTPPIRTPALKKSRTEPFFTETPSWPTLSTPKSQNSRSGALLERLAVAGDRVAVQIEGDVVGTDHDSVVRAVKEVAVERRVDRDRVAATRLLVRGLGPAQRQQADHDQGQGRREQNRRRGGVGAKLVRHPCPPSCLPLGGVALSGEPTARRPMRARLRSRRSPATSLA